MLGDPTQNAATIYYEFVDPGTGAIWQWSAWKNQTEAEQAGFYNYNVGGCTGTPYIMAQLPARYAVTVTEKPGSYYMLPDNVLPTQIGILSEDNGGTCQPEAYTTYAFPFSSLVPLSVTAPPSPPGVPPYHPEIL